MLRLRNDDLTWRSVEGEIIVLDRRNWAYISVDGSGATLWPHIARGTSRRALIEELRAVYAIDAHRAQADVDGFLAMLRAHDLLEQDPAA